MTDGRGNEAETVLISPRPLAISVALPGQHQPDSAPQIAHVNWLEIRVQDQNFHTVPSPRPGKLYSNAIGRGLHERFDCWRNRVSPAPALTRSLLADGHHVWILTRNPARGNIAPGAQAVGWDGRSPAHGWMSSPAWMRSSTWWGKTSVNGRGRQSASGAFWKAASGQAAWPLLAALSRERPAAWGCCCRPRASATAVPRAAANP